MRSTSARPTAHGRLRSRWSGCAGCSAIRRRRGSTSIRGGLPRILARRAASRSPQRRRGRARQADAAASGSDRPRSSPIRSGACPKAIGVKELATRAQAWLAGQQLRDEGRPLASSNPGPRIRSASSSSTWTTSRPSTSTTRPRRPCSRSPERHRSHGCVRVENALEFADLARPSRTIARRVPGSDAASGDETFVKLQDRNPGPPALPDRVL